MTALILILQIAIPAALLLWLILNPARSLVGLALQVLGTGLFLYALARVATWGLPAWWLPRVYGVLWFGTALIRAFEGATRHLPVFSGSRRELAEMAMSLLLCSIGGALSIAALIGRDPPGAEAVDISTPFGPGSYLVANGGGNSLLNPHLRTLDATVERFAAWRGQSFAVDYLGLGAWGSRARGWRPADPSAYAIFGRELRAPCDGIIVAAEGSMPDLPVPQEDTVNRLGNHVIVSCEGAEIVLAHMRQNSLAVAPGAAVTVGQRVGEVGNSGATTEPHLHIHAQRPPPAGAPAISGDPLVLRIDGRFPVRGDRLTIW